VSDTPITDSRLTAILDSDGFVHNGNCPQRWVNQCRELERELNAANESFRKLNIHALNLAARIKRLEEAGDKIVEAGWSVQDWSGMCVVWAKAKENRP